MCVWVGRSNIFEIPILGVGTPKTYYVFETHSYGYQIIMHIFTVSNHTSSVPMTTNPLTVTSQHIAVSINPSAMVSHVDMASSPITMTSQYITMSSISPLWYSYMLLCHQTPPMLSHNMLL